MVSLDMQTIVHWFTTNASLIAVLVTVGVAVFLVCCLHCSDCSCPEKDDIFRHRQV